MKYGVIPAVHNANLEVREGQIVALLGANGANKTTILKTIMGILKPAGEISIIRVKVLTFFLLLNG